MINCDNVTQFVRFSSGRYSFVMTIYLQADDLQSGQNPADACLGGENAVTKALAEFADLTTELVVVDGEVHYVKVALEHPQMQFSRVGELATVLGARGWDLESGEFMNFTIDWDSQSKQNLEGEELWLECELEAFE